MGLCCRCRYGQTDINESVCTDCMAIIKEEIRICQNKPPIGIEPKSIWEQQRVNSLVAAIERYLKRGCLIPTEWIKEYNESVNTAPISEMDKWRKTIAQYSVDKFIERAKTIDWNDKSSTIRLLWDIESAVGVRKTQEFYAFLQLYIKHGDA